MGDTWAQWRLTVLLLAIGLGLGSAMAADHQTVPVERAVSDQLAEVEVEVLIERAIEHRRAGAYRLVVARLQEARLKAEETALPDRQAVLGRIDALLQEAADQRQADERHDHAERRRLAQQEALSQQRGLSRSQRNRFEERLRRIVDLQQRDLLELALEQCRMLVGDYPQNDLAKETYQRLLDAVHKQRRSTTEERLRFLKQERNDAMARMLVPRGFDGKPEFPDDWDRRRTRSMAAIGGDLPVVDQVLHNALAQRVSVDFDNLEPALCIDMLSQRVGVNMIVDVSVRAAPPGTVTLRARNMRLDHVLDWITRQTGLQWRIEREAVFITDQPDEEVVTRIYEVGLLLYGAPEFGGVEMGLSDSEDGGGGIWDVGSVEEGEGLAPEDLTDLVEMTLGLEQWGRPGHGMRIFGTQLIASCSPTLHAQLEVFLERFQKEDDIQVNVGSRWVRLRKGFAEEIGVDWEDALTTPVFPIDPNDPAATFPRPPGLVDDGERLGWWRESPEFFFAGRARSVLPGGGIGELVEAPGLANAGLSLTVGRLGTWQLAAIFQAVQQDRYGRQLHAIDLTARNGTRANAFVGGAVSYISDYEVTQSGESGALFAPIIEQINVGMSLEIKPLVSADRRYVTLDFQPTLLEATFAPVTIAVSQSIQVGGGETSLTGTPVELAIQLPSQQLVRFNTRVMVPDGGSLLVGGLRSRAEATSRSHIPLLGNIPFLGRLFGRRGRYRSDKELYLMATVQIFLYPELEAQL